MNPYCSEPIPDVYDPNVCFFLLFFIIHTNNAQKKFAAKS